MVVDRGEASGTDGQRNQELLEHHHRKETPIQLEQLGLRFQSPVVVFIPRKPQVGPRKTDH